MARWFIVDSICNRGDANHGDDPPTSGSVRSTRCCGSGSYGFRMVSGLGSSRTREAESCVQVLHPGHTTFVVPHACRRVACQQHPTPLPTILVCTRFPLERHRADTGDPSRRGVCHHCPDGQRCSNYVTPARTTLVPITHTTAGG